MKTKNLSVLYITHARDLSGANSSLIQMITELRDNHNVEPFVLYPKRPPTNKRTIEDALKERGIEGASCGRMVCFQRENTSFLYKIYFVISEAINLFQILWLCRNRKFDFVHTNTSILDLGLFTALLLRIPHIWHLREVAWISYKFKPILGKGYMRWLFNKSTHIIAISNNVKKEFLPYIPVNRTTVIYNGVLPPKKLRKPNLIVDNFRLCVVGRVEENKNQLEAVKAIELLIRKGRRNIKLFIIGDYDNKYGFSVIDYVHSHKLTEYVDFMGIRGDVDILLQTMNVGLMLSKHEAFGRVTVEYMQHGLFTIASNTSANIEIIQDGVNGFLYEFGSPDSLAEVIENIIINTKLLLHVADNGLKDASEKYLSINNSESVFSLYNNLCG